jgi:phosphopantetheine adenylyltransferase
MKVKVSQIKSAIGRKEHHKRMGGEVKEFVPPAIYAELLKKRK